MKHDNMHSGNKELEREYKSVRKNIDMQEEKFNALIKIALCEQLDWEEEYENMPEEEHEFSEAFEQKMEAFMTGTEEKRKHRFKGTSAAAILAVILLAAGMVGGNVEAIRVPIFSFLKFEEYSVLDYGNKKEVIEIPEEYVQYAPSYVPEGFALVYVHAEEKRCYLQYIDGINGKGYDITILEEKNRIAFDSEDSQQEEMRLGGYEILMAEKENAVWISCDIGKRTYWLEGDIEMDAFEKILESIG